MEIALGLIISYLLGSVPSAYIITRWRKGADIRQVGSRNMGAMNVMYSVGILAGLAALTLDFSKGIGAIFIVRWLGAPQYAEMLGGAIAVFGHMFPVFLKFRGGKGGATCIGVFFALMPHGIYIFYGIFGLLVLLTRYLTLAYSVALICFPFVAWLIYNSAEMVIFSAAMLVLLGLRYVPRMIEMRSTAGSWRRVAFRSNLRERF
ncbi:MAG: glycerol-3-phosphate acyltransferase [Dehalococcoidales bacterium]